MTNKIKLNLIQKFVSIMAALLLVFFVATGFMAHRALKKQVLLNIKHSIGMLTSSEGYDIEEYFKSLEKLGRQSSDTIQKWIEKEITLSDRQSFDEKYHRIRGALRTNLDAFPHKDISAVFVSNRSRLSDDTKDMILATEHRFDEYARGIKAFVFNMYLITRDQMIRIYEKDWALEIESEHDFTKDIFYYIADPAHNPSREPKWTPPYYDSIWKHWMTSLITPIYQNDHFIGIVGHDVILDDIYQKVLSKKFFKSGYGFIFDKNLNVVIHPRHLDRLFETAQMGTYLSFREIDSPELTDAISNIVKMDVTGSSVLHKTFTEKNYLNHLFAYRLDFLEWYFGVVIPQNEVVWALDQFNNKFAVGAVVLSLALFTAIALVMWLLVLSPIGKLTRATREIESGRFGKKLAVKHRDEIGELSLSFNNMSDRLYDTLDQLKSDIAERQRVEKELRVSEERYKALTELLPIAIFEINAKGNVTFANRSATQSTGYGPEDFKRGLNIFEVIDPRDHDQVLKLSERVFQGIYADGAEYLIKRKDGGTYHGFINARPTKDSATPGLMGYIFDLTNLKETERALHESQERLQQAQKMEAIGLLAGGVAHDLNNVLSGIVSYPDLLLMDLEEDSPLREPILTIQSSGQKAAEIVQDMLSLARRGVENKAVLNLNDIIMEYLDSPEFDKLKAYHPKVGVETDLDTGLLNMEGSLIQLKKMMMNLLSNAAEAQPSGGKIIVSTRNRYIDTPIKGYEEIKQGEFAVLEVKDHGFGIAVEDLTRIFEPFYTKKVMGRSGTGLGMAVVWGTTHDNNGYLDINSTEGVGTTFSLYFPITRQNKIMDRGIIPVEAYMGNKEKVLVIDDVKEQRDIATNILGKLNYSVTTVSCGEDAVDYLKNNTVDILVLDMIMDPGIDGLETYRRILKRYPTQKAIIASGYSETDRVKAVQKLGAGEYLKKPYTLEKIGIAVNQALNPK